MLKLLLTDAKCCRHLLWHVPWHNLLQLWFDIPKKRLRNAPPLIKHLRVVYLVVTYLKYLDLQELLKNSFWWILWLRSLRSMRRLYSSVGILLCPPVTHINSCFIIWDCQNMTSPASLIKFLQSKPWRVLRRRSNNKIPSEFTNLPPNFKQRLYYTKIHTLPELMLFLHQLPALLISQPKVSK